MLYNSGRHPDRLSPEDRDRLSYLLIQWFQTFDYVLELGKAGKIDKRWVVGAHKEVSRSARNPEVRQFVERNKHWFSDELLSIFGESQIAS